MHRNGDQFRMGQTDWILLLRHHKTRGRVFVIQLHEIDVRGTPDMEILTKHINIKHQYGESRKILQLPIQRPVRIETILYDTLETKKLCHPFPTHRKTRGHSSPNLSRTH